jgi:hypothetical protein
VEYSLSLPGTNAPVERVFSLINNTWTSEKTQLQLKNLKAILAVRFNNKPTCSEVYQQILQNQKLCKTIHSL